MLSYQFIKDFLSPQHFNRICNFASAPLFSAEQIFFSADATLSRTLQNHWQKHTSEHLFYRMAPCCVINNLY